MTTSDIEALLAEGRFDEAVCSYVKQNQHVSYPELERLLGPYMPVKGEWVTGPEEYDNIVFWVGMSKELVDLLNKLHEDGRLHRHASSLLVYMIDGAMPTMPIAKRVRQYKKTHWLPVTFCTYPPGKQP